MVAFCPEMETFERHFAPVAERFAMHWRGENRVLVYGDKTVVLD